MKTESVAATCARCGHPAETGTPGSGHSPWGCDVRECHCAGYRTPEQQAAWEFLFLMYRQRGTRGFQEEKLLDGVRQLLDLYS